MKTTSLETSKAIYAAFPEWEDTEYRWQRYKKSNGEWTVWKTYNRSSENRNTDMYEDVTTYTLGFLLDKLPQPFTLLHRDNGWECGNQNPAIPITQHPRVYWINADNPTEAAGKLVLRLLERKWYSTTNVKQDDH